MSLSVGLFVWAGSVPQTCHVIKVSPAAGLLELGWEPNLSLVLGRVGKSTSFLCPSLLVVFGMSNLPFFLTTDSSIEGNSVPPIEDSNSSL